MKNRSEIEKAEVGVHKAGQEETDWIKRITNAQTPGYEYAEKCTEIMSRCESTERVTRHRWNELMNEKATERERGQETR